MAVDAFLKLKDIKGESNDDKHAGWIDVLSYSFGISNTGFIGGPGGGAGAGKANLSDFNFMHAFDLASPVLFLKCAQGAHIEDAQLEVRNSGAKQETFLKVKFENVMISAVQPSGLSEHPMESVSFVFGKISMVYTGGGGSSEAG